MRRQKWHLPKNKWVQNWRTGKWYSRKRTQMDVVMMKEAIANMCWIDVSAVVWIPQHHYFVVERP